MKSWVLLLFLFVFAAIAQAAEASPDSGIIAFLKKQHECAGQYSQFDVKSVQVGPGKDGFIGSCTGGDGMSVLYQQTTKGLRKLLEVGAQMNSEFSPSGRVTNGYYDMVLSARSGSETMVQTFRWNGKRHVGGKWTPSR